MMEDLATLLFVTMRVLVAFALPAIGVVLSVRDVMIQNWKRGVWFFRCVCVSAYLGVAFWIAGASARPSVGFETYDAFCGRRGWLFDELYYETHRDDYARLYPITGKCNAYYDLVPAWVNPAIAALILMTLLCLAGMAWIIIRRCRSNSPFPT
ncbi:hypothetical protein [Tessaracoccus antarcticus]|uniref:Uncharacterized protein n=1 Tax=Tessaracoccus antarcticus TaxID=2479848 RepID=A0A3M0FX53_9ACTN|nr:hypothetical protein [Tessaracoccus antarcticus]RMB57075.1 hypothetical protein EAX62_16420 [Tessaracoccus antarcticus]